MPETTYKEQYADYWMDMFIKSGLEELDESDTSFETEVVKDNIQGLA